MSSLGTMMDYPLTLDHLLVRAERMFPAVPVVSRLPDRSLHRTTYGQVARRARALAEALARAGLRPGDRVATLMWNHAAHLETYLGVPLAGGVVHTLNLRLSPEELAFIVSHADDRFLVVDEVLVSLWEKVRPRASVEKVVVVSAAQAGEYEALLGTATGQWTPPRLAESDPCGMCYTSGTTGQSKGVVYTHRSTMIHTLAAGLPDLLGIRHADAVMPVVPMFHANAWGLPYASVLNGAKAVFPGPALDPESLLDLMAEEQVTMSAGVPTVWIPVLEALDREPRRWPLVPGLRLIVGGSAAPESLLRGFDRHGITVVHAWGMTEMSPLGSLSHPGPEAPTLDEAARYRQRARQGRASPLVEIRVVNESGEVPWDDRSMGELQVRGPWVTARYHENEEAKDRWTADGWFRTGDVVTLDATGSIKLADRTKDLVKSGGEWISSVDLENALMGHPAVKEAAVVAVPHSRWGERPLATVVLKAGKTISAAELQDWLRPKFPKFWIPDAIVFADVIPRTSAGKFQKSELRERYAGWTWPPTTSSG
jgi:acyl-CoA synthetase (AMP-forming)/AMP-acid ligase II